MEDETQSTFLKYLEIQNLETCTGGSKKGCKQTRKTEIRLYVLN